jgi:hypothetical protein
MLVRWGCGAWSWFLSVPGFLTQGHKDTKYESGPLRAFSFQRSAVSEKRGAPVGSSEDALEEGRELPGAARESRMPDPGWGAPPR